jgi:hypothetical protein
MLQGLVILSGSGHQKRAEYKCRCRMRAQAVLQAHTQKPVFRTDTTWQSSGGLATISPLFPPHLPMQHSRSPFSRELNWGVLRLCGAQQCATSLSESLPESRSNQLSHAAALDSARARSNSQVVCTHASNATGGVGRSLTSVRCCSTAVAPTPPSAAPCGQ